MHGLDGNRDVLIVDDDEVMGELLVTLMGLEGYRVAHACSAEDALAQLRGAMPDVILCDLQMPGMRGGDLAEALAAARADGRLPKSTVLLGMSGSAPEAGEASHFDGFLQKPFTVEEFAAKVSQIREQGTRGEARSGATAAGPEHGANEGATRSPIAERTLAQLRSKLEDAQLRELYNMTLDDVQERLRRMRIAAEAGDAVAVRREAHTIKGSCGMVGAVELQELAAATEGGSVFDTVALANFDAACKRLRRMLEETL